MRKFNYTNRQRIDRSEYILSITHGIDQNNSYFDFEINKSMADSFNPESKLVIEAYYRTTYMRFEYGTIGTIKVPPQRYLTAFSDPNLVRFRVKVINQNGMIEGLANLVKPDSDDDKNEKHKESILDVANRNLDGAIWEMEFDDDLNPIILIDSDLDKLLLNYDVELKASIVPHAFQQILTEIIFFSEEGFDFSTEELDHDWRSRWCLFCESLNRKLSFEEISAMDDEDKQKWINETVRCFSRRMGYKEKLLKALSKK
jgi:hypothetical protein